MKRRSSTVCGEGRVSPTVKRTKVQAQRKFAQGSSNYTYSATKIIPKTPESAFPPFPNGQQSSSSPENEKCELNNFSSLPTVDDFLTFLCFRETDVLPERLNYLNNPQFDVLPAKKKPLKSSTVAQSSNSQSNDQSKNLTRKTNYDLKNKKNAEYKLRSRNTAVPGKNIVTKTSRSLALKHNQRLRSKSVVHAKAKICESKLQNLKIKPTLPSKLKPCVVPKSILKTEKGRPSTRTLKKDVVSKPENRECKNSKRVTRRNLLLEKSSKRASSPSKDGPGKKSVSIKSPANFGVKEMSVCLHDSLVLKKPSARSQRISLPKVKSAVTNALASDKSSPKPTTRSTRSGSSHTAEALPSTNVNSRPSRRTKEAAALYMEMLGKELLCPEENFDDDDNVSIESFPELPNAEQHMRREKELKEMNRKKILEKTPPRKTSTPKAKPFVKPSESCLPPKVPKDSVKTSVQEKTIKESVKVSESVETAKDVPKRDDTKSVKDSLKATEPVKVAKETSKTSELVKTTQESTTKVPEKVKVNERVKDSLKATELVKAAEETSKTSELVKTTQESTKVPEKVKVNEPSRTVVLENIILVAKSDSARKQGLCTRSKQYNEPTTSVRSEQSAKTVRTRGRSVHLGRRNSYNDVYDKSKRANHFLARESRRRSAKLISFVELSSGESDFLSEDDDTPISTCASAKTAPEMLKNSDLKNSAHRVPGTCETKTAMKGDEKRVLSTRTKKRDHSVERRKSCSDVLEKSIKSLDKDSGHRKNVKPTYAASANPSKVAKLTNASKANDTSHHDSAKPADSGRKKPVDSNCGKNGNPSSDSRDSVTGKVDTNVRSSGSPSLSELFSVPKAPASEKRPNSKSAKSNDKPAVQTALPNRASSSKSKDVKKNEKSESEDSEDDYKPISMHLLKPPATVAAGKSSDVKAKPTAVNDINAVTQIEEPSVFRGFSPPSRKAKTKESESDDSEDDYQPISRIRDSLSKAVEAAALKDGSNLKPVKSGDEPAVQVAVPSNKTSSLKSKGKKKDEREPEQSVRAAETVDFADTSRPKGTKTVGSDSERSLGSLKPEDAQPADSDSEKSADSSQIKRTDAVDSSFEKRPKPAEMGSVEVTSSSSISPSTSEVVTPSDESDFKKPQQERQFFARPKTAKSVDKPVIQTVVLSTSKVFSLESKKIFKKNASSVAAEQKEELSPRKAEAFSADNENSVYAFEPDLPTTSPPFRRLKPVTPPKQIAGNSIAVQVSFENDSKLQCSSSAEAATSSTADCCGDRVFYIPIQTSSTTSTLGVAVKLDTDGSNQKIIMSATLITNSPTCTTNTATTVSAKTLDVETTCVQTETSKLRSEEQAVKKPIVDSAKIVGSTESESKQTPDTVTSSTAKTGKKTTATKANTQSVRIVKLSKNKKGASNSKTKILVPDSKTKKPAPEPAKPEKPEEPAVVKTKSRPVDSEPVSLEAVKVKSRPASSGSAKPEAVKPKARPAKNKNVKKPTEESQSGADEPPSMPAGDILEAPTFYPTEEEFSDPLEYIDKIRSVAEKFGLCRIVPPSNFRPECKVVDDMRFTAYNQYVHKMLHRWGPNVKEMMAIKKFLATQNITFTHPPLIGGMEVDLPRLYQIVQQCGGLKAVIEKERWHMVADIMKIPKLAHDRITKLDDIYCKYLLPYDILSHDEREKLFEEIEKEWMAHLKNSSEDEVFDDIDECIVKGRTMPLSCFYRIARNTMMTCFGNAEGQVGPSTEKIEEEFWSHVSKRKSHMCVHCGSIDSGTHGYGFSVAKNSTFRKHPWNLKVLTNNTASILRFLGPVMGVTVPTLHVGMLYSACCWYRDPHGLPWIEYLHTGANKIWYGIPDDHSEQFKEGMLLLVPRYCRDKKIWLPSDTVMIPPPLLTAQNVSLSRVVQHPGQFIVVFPKAFTSSVSTGYLVSESVYFAHAEWLDSAKQVFMDMQDSCEPSVFSLEQLVISIAEDSRPSVSILAKVLLLLLDLKDTEIAFRSQLKKLGLNTIEKLNVNKKRKSKGAVYEEDSYECETCRTNLFVSLVVNAHEQCHYCLRHAVALLSKKPTQVKHCTLMYSYTEEELHGLVDKVKARIEAKSSKKSHGK